MNTIKTVGELVKALSAYDQNMTIEFSVNNQTLLNSLNNDTQIYQQKDRETETKFLHIGLLTGL